MKRPKIIENCEFCHRDAKTEVPVAKQFRWLCVHCCNLLSEILAEVRFMDALERGMAAMNRKSEVDTSILDHSDPRLHHK